MVDFQKRDTRRGLEEKPDEPETDEDPETEAPSVPDAAELAARAAAEQADETGDDPEPGSTDANAGADPSTGTDAEPDGGAGDDDHAGHDEGPTRDEHDHGNHGHGEHDHGDHEHTHHDHGDHEQAHHDHADGGHHAHDVDSLGVAVVTVSSTRSLADDPAGDAIVGTLDADGHEVVTRELIGDDLDGIQRSVNALAARGDVDVVVTTGGTGVTPDDVTPEAVEPLFDKELPGFGELFRELSREEIGSRVVATRAVGGVVEGVPVFCLPGSEAAATLGIEAIVLPEAPHLAGLARRDEGDADGH